MISDIYVLTSPTKIEIIRILKTPRTPDQLATSINITRQGIEKHLKEMMKYGIVDRKWFMGFRRPRIEYFLTEAGVKFYRDLESLWKNHIILSESYIKDKIRSLDLKLADGAIDSKIYSDEIGILQESLEFMKRQGD